MRLQKRKDSTQKKTEEYDSQNPIQQLVTILIHYISFLRNVFDEECFVDTEYFSTTSNKNEGFHEENCFKIKKLIKGKNKDADDLIDCIENGIKEAIFFKYLKAIQYTICFKKKGCIEIIETYLLFIDYKNNSLILSIKNELQESFIYSSFQKTALSLLKNLIDSTQKFESLPEKKFFFIRLHFNETCPEIYQPFFFQEESFSTIPKIQISKFVKKNNLNIGSLDIDRSSIEINILINEKESDDSLIIDPLFLKDVLNSIENKKVQCKIDFPDHFFFDDSLFLNKYSTNVPSKNNSMQSIFFESNKIVSDPLNESPCESGCVLSDLINTSNCDKCNRKIILACYGENSKTSVMTCYTCLFNKTKLDSYLVILMKIRYLWNYMMHHKMPTFNQICLILNLKKNNDDNTRIIFNKIFQDNILITLDNPIYESNSLEYVDGCGLFVPLIDKIKNDKSIELKKNHKYYLGFVPKLKDKYSYLKFNENILNFYFPSSFKNRKFSVLKILNEFKLSFNDHKYIQENCNSMIHSLNVKSIEKNSSDNESFLKQIVSSDKKKSNLKKMEFFSFKDSLNFLSQTENLKKNKNFHLSKSSNSDKNNFEFKFPYSKIRKITID